MKPRGTSFAAGMVKVMQKVISKIPSAKILSAFASEMPLMAMSCFWGVNATDSTVWNLNDYLTIVLQETYPASASFLRSEAPMPNCYGSDRVIKPKLSYLELTNRHGSSDFLFHLFLDTLSFHLACGHVVDL